MTTASTAISEVAISELLGEEHVEVETTLLLEQVPVMLIGQAAHRADMGVDFAGTDILTILERTGWAIEGVNRSGEIISNPSRLKLLREVWPIIRGTVGDVLSWYAGYQDTAEANTLVWTGPFSFTIGVDKSFQPLVEGAYLALKVQSLGINPWALLGIELDVEPTGELYD